MLEEPPPGSHPGIKWIKYPRWMPINTPTSEQINSIVAAGESALRAEGRHVGSCFDLTRCSLSQDSESSTEDSGREYEHLCIFSITDSDIVNSPHILRGLSIPKDAVILPSDFLYIEDILVLFLVCNINEVDLSCGSPNSVDPRRLVAGHRIKFPVSRSFFVEAALIRDARSRGFTVALLSEDSLTDESVLTLLSLPKGARLLYGVCVCSPMDTRAVRLPLHCPRVPPLTKRQINAIIDAGRRSAPQSKQNLCFVAITDPRVVKHSETMKVLLRNSGVRSLQRLQNPPKYIYEPSGYIVVAAAELNATTVEELFNGLPRAMRDAAKKYGLGAVTLNFTEPEDQTLIRVLELEKTGVVPLTAICVGAVMIPQPSDVALPDQLLLDEWLPPCCHP